MRAPREPPQSVLHWRGGGGDEQGHFFSVLKRRPHRAHLEHDHLTLPPRNTCASRQPRTVLERVCLFSERSAPEYWHFGISACCVFAMTVTLRASAKFTIQLVSFCFSYFHWSSFVCVKLCPITFLKPRLLPWNFCHNLIYSTYRLWLHFLRKY